jgi:hypothetical protein
LAENKAQAAEGVLAADSLTLPNQNFKKTCKIRRKGYALKKNSIVQEVSISIIKGIALEFHLLSRPFYIAPE